MQHFFKEARFLMKNLSAAEQSNEELLQAIEPTDAMSPREKLEHRFTKNTQSAASRIKAADTKWTTYLGSRFSNKDADKKTVDMTITQIAQERAMKGQENIRGFAGKAERTLLTKSANATNSLTILEMKLRVCDEVMKDLGGEIEAKQKLRDDYNAALQEIGKLQGKHTDVPMLSRIQLKQEAVQKIKIETEQKISERMNDETIARTSRIHDHLKGFLLNANPGLATNIDRMLLDNAAGANDNLLKAINELPVIDRKEKAMLRDLAKHLSLGMFSFANNRAVREVYQAKVSSAASLNPPKLKDRMAQLFDKAPIGQGVVVMIDGTRMNFGVIRKESKKRKKVVLVDNQGRQNAVMDVTEKSLTYRNASGDFVHCELVDTPLKAPDNDPMKVQFSARQTSISLFISA